MAFVRSKSMITEVVGEVLIVPVGRIWSTVILNRIIEWAVRMMWAFGLGTIRTGRASAPAAREPFR